MHQCFLQPCRLAGVRRACDEHVRAIAHVQPGALAQLHGTTDNLTRRLLAAQLDILLEVQRDKHSIVHLGVIFTGEAVLLCYRRDVVLRLNSNVVNGDGEITTAERHLTASLKCCNFRRAESTNGGCHLLHAFSCAASQPRKLWVAFCLRHRTEVAYSHNLLHVHLLLNVNIEHLRKVTDQVRVRVANDHPPKRHLHWLALIISNLPCQLENVDHAIHARLDRAHVNCTTLHLERCHVYHLVRLGELHIVNAL
mmetsp:Transcript_7739/g.19964  ORF Transcript_7739/g.19964 Transcript_7739/m.19964 type:complete len:253 (-) Transcript_7739:979-1737(-)